MANSCEQPFQASVNFNIYDSDDFEIDSDDETVLVPANGTVVARGTMLISPSQRLSACLSRERACLCGRN